MFVLKYSRGAYGPINPDSLTASGTEHLRGSPLQLDSDRLTEQLEIFPLRQPWGEVTSRVGPDGSQFYPLQTTEINTGRRHDCFLNTIELDILPVQLPPPPFLE